MYARIFLVKVCSLVQALGTGLVRAFRIAIKRIVLLLSKAGIHEQKWFAKSEVFRMSRFENARARHQFAPEKRKKG